MEHQLWWLMPVILALRKVRQKDFKFETSPGYIARMQKEKKNGFHINSTTNSFKLLITRKFF
jgi:hypothetical protein